MNRHTLTDMRLCGGFRLLFLFVAAALPAWGNKEKSTVVEVTGIVRLVGSSPVYELVISGPDMEWYVAREEEYKLKDLQQRIVTVKGSETVTELTFANGFPAGERRTLKKIKVIASQ